MADKISEEDIVTRIRGEITDSLGYSDTISKQREMAMDYYYSLPFGNEVEGRSQFVDSTVQDTIEWLKPSLMRVFASGDTMVTFSPVGPEDVKAAKQATDYVNHVFMKDNHGWEILYSWFTDALLQKNGIVKIWWDETEKWNREEYKGLDDEELAALVADDDVEVIEHTSPGEEEETSYGVTSSEGHHVVITRNVKRGSVRIENVPPDEFLISREAKTLQDARFVCHRVPKTLSDLREMYPDQNLEPEDLTGGGFDEDEYSMERLSRYEFDKSANYWGDAWGGGSYDESLRTYWLHESFLRADYNNDGIAELRKVCTVGNKVLSNDEIDRYPFVSLTPIKIPHKFFGLSVADLVMDLQLMKSTLMRNLMDNMYNQNFGRYAVLEGQANLDDLLTQRPGGIVRVKSPNAIMPLTTPPLQPYSFQMLTYLDGIRESRSGVSKNTQGLNDDALKSHQTATAVAQVMTAAQARVELIARNFAETGVKELMLGIYELVQKNQDKERVIQLNNEWVTVRPDMWRDKSDCTISVGLGHGNRDQQMMHLSQMMQFASQAMSGGLNIVTEQNLYNMGAALIRNMGFQNVHDFLTDPSAAPQKVDPRQEMAQAELEIKKGELEIKTAETQIKAQKLQLETAKLQSDNQFKMAELALEKEQNRAVAIGAT
jgi:hypothetical protein